MPRTVTHVTLAQGFGHAEGGRCEEQFFNPTHSPQRKKELFLKRYHSKGLRHGGFARGLEVIEDK
jgi:hypothetical protein